MNFLSKIFLKKQKDPLINVLTRTSNRPVGFNVNRNSVLNQTYKNFRHIISFDDEKDLAYLEKYNDLELIKVTPIKRPNTEQQQFKGYKFAPYNLYCNALLSEVSKGWVIFLDDDDRFLESTALEQIANVLKQSNKKTLVLWQMQYPDGKVLPPISHMKSDMIKQNNIGAPCFTFHYNLGKNIKWDSWKAGDFRFLKKIWVKSDKREWLYKPLIQLNNEGDFGNKNDI